MKLSGIREPVGKAVLNFSLPFLLSYFLQTLYGMADLYIIGQFSSVAATTAVSIGSQVMHMLTVMIVGLAMGAVVVIGQSVGAGDTKAASKAIGNTLSLFAAFSLGLTLLLLFLLSPILRVMATPEAALSGTRAYLFICFLGLPLITAYNVISAILRGMGDSKSPLYFVAAACAINIGLDYLFIGAFHLGPAGAALGTVIAQGFSVGLALIILRKKRKGPALAWKNLTPDRPIMGRILKIGLPVMFQDGFIQVAFLIVTVFANHRGLEDAAAVGIVEKLIGLLFLAPSAMLQTVSALSALNIGAGRPDRVKKILAWGCCLCVGWGLLAVAVMHFHSEAIIGLFLDDKPTVLKGCQYMRSYVWDCVFAGIHFCFSGFFCAYGLSGLSFLHNALSIACVRLPLSYFAATRFSSLFPLGLASTAGSILSVIICLTAYLIKRKKF